MPDRRREASYLICFDDSLVYGSLKVIPPSPQMKIGVRFMLGRHLANKPIIRQTT
ncbi:MAG TPA: hypothetical protein VGZ71_15840 [Puia sp.]|nr:hypothetical protein [Puia sp.]